MPRFSANYLLYIVLCLGFLIFIINNWRDTADDADPAVVLMDTAPRLPPLDGRLTDRPSDQEAANHDPIELPFDTMAPFLEGESKMVIILSYQRCGSTYFASLFNTNPNAFYMFEPLDALYSALYGTSMGWNVPTDIISFSNGTERVIPPDEKAAVADYLGNLLSCDTTKLPLQTFTHHYYNLFRKEFINLHSFSRCMLKYNLKKPCNETKSVNRFCGIRFGRQYDRMALCNRYLWHNDYSDPDMLWSTSTMFQRYDTCMKERRDKADRLCVPVFNKICEKSPLRAVKTVRATMASMEPIIAKHPNVRVIHLIRDPRGVVFSRKRYNPSAQGTYSRGDLVKEAQLYCHGVTNDVIERKRIEKLHPGRTMQVIYEEFAENPILSTMHIYNFLKSNLPDVTLNYLKENTKNISRQGFDEKWMKDVTFKESAEIVEQCRELFKNIKHPWMTVS